MKKTILIFLFLFLFFIVVIITGSFFGVKKQRIEGAFSHRYQELVSKETLTLKEEAELQKEYELGIQKIEVFIKNRNNQQINGVRLRFPQ